MSYKINDECISCGACEPECPNQAINEGDTTYEVDPSRCTECIGAHESQRCTDVCPVECIEKDNEEGKDALLARWKTLHPGQEPAAGTY